MSTMTKNREVNLGMVCVGLFVARFLISLIMSPGMNERGGR